MLQHHGLVECIFGQFRQSVVFNIIQSVVSNAVVTSCILLLCVLCTVLYEKSLY